MEPTPSLRLFIATHLHGVAAEPLLRLTEAHQQAMANEPSLPAIRWTVPEQWHLTWHFLGDTSQELMPELQNALNTALTGMSPIVTDWQNLSWWPSPHKPQVLVCRLQASPQIQAVYEAIDQALLKITGHHKAKTNQNNVFKPHITLARFNQRRAKQGNGPSPSTRGSADRIPTITLPDIATARPPWRIDAITLYSSTLSSRGATHTGLHTVQLV